MNTKTELLTISPVIRDNLLQLGFHQLTPIQQLSLQPILDKKDLLAAAQTGTGKTAAFAIPIIENLLNQQNDEQENRPPRVLIIVPTRELATQVHQSVVNIAHNTNIKTGLIYGGVSFKQQQKQLKQGSDIVIATPGRLLDHLFNRNLSLKSIQCWVLDEADRLLDLGFKPDLQRIKRYLPEGIQTLYFSATYKPNVKRLAYTLLNDPIEVSVAQDNQTADNIEERAYQLDKKHKAPALAYLIGSGNWQQVLVFVKTKQGVDELVKQLKLDGIKAVGIHGDKSQGTRSRSLDEFKQGKVRVLVATDVAARGIDIQALDYVVNYDIPFKAEDYIHRIGRTARAGLSGVAVSFVTAQDEAMVENIERLIDRRLAPQWLAGFEPSFERTDNERKPKRRSKSKAKAQLKKKLGY